MIADRELCAELFELSRWEDTYFQWRQTYTVDSWIIVVSDKGQHDNPAYDFDYCASKLEQFDLVKHNDGRYEIHPYEHPDIATIAYTPANVIVALCIAMFKKRLLRREVHEG